MTLVEHTAVPDSEPDDLADTRLRRTIIFHAPFDRVYALTSLGAMGIFLAGWAPPTPVRIAGTIIAAVTLPWAGLLLVRELRPPLDERGVDFEDQVLTGRPLRRHRWRVSGRRDKGPLELDPAGGRAGELEGAVSAARLVGTADD